MPRRNRDAPNRDREGYQSGAGLAARVGRHNRRVRRRVPDSLHAAAAFRGLAAALLLTAAVARGEDVTAVLSRPDKPAATLRAEERDGRTFLSVNDAVLALEGTMTFDEKTRSYEVRLKGRSAVFGVDAALAVVSTAYDGVCEKRKTIFVVSPRSATDVSTAISA